MPTTGTVLGLNVQKERLFEVFALDEEAVIAPGRGQTKI
jgi:hypothetical protein